MLPQMIISMLRSFGKSIFKNVLSPKTLFTNLVKKGTQFGKNANDFTKAIQNDTKKFLKDKLNFKSNISTFFQDQVEKLTNKALGINSRATIERHKYINRLKKTGASIVEILEFEKEYGLDPNRAKAEYNKLVVPRIDKKAIKEPEIEEESLPEVPEELGVLGQYISKAWSSLSKAGSLHSKDTIKTIIQLDENMSSENKQLLDGLIDSMDESNLMSANNSEEVQRQVAMASQLSSRVQEEIAKMTSEQSTAISEGFKNIEESIKLYAENQGQRIDMLGALSEMAVEEPEEETQGYSFAELMRGNSLIVDLISQSQKNPMEILQSFDQAMNEFVKDIGKEVGFYGGIVWGMLDASIKRWPAGEWLLGGVRDMLGNLIGISPEAESEEQQEEKFKINNMDVGTFRRSSLSVSDNAKGIIETQISYGNNINEVQPSDSKNVNEDKGSSSISQNTKSEVVIINNDNNNTVRGDYRVENKTPPQPNGDRRI